MKYNPDESYEEWVRRVELFEKGRALQRLAQGEPAEQILEDMSRRMMEKMLHPVIKAMMPVPPSIEEIQQGRKEYEEKMRKIGPAADHILDDNIDKGQ